MARNRPRIISTNSRMTNGPFVNSLFIRGWSLGAAGVPQGDNIAAGVTVRCGEELRPLFGRTLLPSMLDRAFKGEL
jgi:hypothetical protein